MRFSSILMGIALAGVTNAAEPVIHIEGRQNTARAPPLPVVPGYNFTMPIDHFTKSDTRTFKNQYFVNDTYYKPGGPVILFDVGESTFTPSFRAQILAEYNGTISSPVRLAARLNGLLIGWEHRYYGYSQPFPVDEYAGIPTNGAAGYKYLTVEQGLEDLVYFANNFNATTLDKNSNVKSTANLDPYHTPWIHFGGSYTGARAAWSRQRNPEVFYASWASSAPVQVLVDGSIYYNPMARSLPSNCTKDLHSISVYVDQVFTSGTLADVRAVQAGAYLMQTQYKSSMDITAAYSYTANDVVNVMRQAAADGEYQSWGAGATIQVFCDYLQSFDTQAYLNARKQLATTADLRDVTALALFNRGGARASTNGIVADNGQSGPALGFAAFIYAYPKYKAWREAWTASIQWVAEADPRVTVQTNSWTWQTLVQMGYFQTFNLSSSFYTTKWYNISSVYSDVRYYSFPSFKSSDIPSRPDTSYPNSFGGWNMKPSNVMFTNGEYDPWRAFGVHSQDTGAPMRRVTTDVPKCNTPPSGTDVFGILYKGGAHVEDLATYPNFRKASEETTKPGAQGLELFVKAYNTWQPCFNQSRDSIRNGKGVDGQGNSANGTSPSSSSSSNSNSGNKNAAGRFASTNGYAAWSALILGLVSSGFALL